MKGLLIWAYSYCRSTLAFFRELSLNFGFTPKLMVLNWQSDARTKVGFSSSEFENIDITFINNDKKTAIDVLLKHKDWNHIFASYQKKNLYTELISIAIANDITYGIASEAPCNMVPGVFKHAVKDLYLTHFLKYKLKKTVINADFIINLSGYYQEALSNLGWPANKTISCGYYPPPVPLSHCIKRNEGNWNEFKILLTGIHQWHRSPILLVKALRILNDKGIKYKCYITQNGPCLSILKEYVERYNIPNIEFLGFVPIETLVKLYETCSVYVGAGNFEPWGMRLNDVLQCGAPLIVNRGMGGAKLVDDYACGLTFNLNDSVDLAFQLERLITDEKLYLKCAENAFNAANLIKPKLKAKEIANIIKDKFINWN